MRWTWIALGLTLIMAVLWGGQLSVDVMPISEGLASALLGGPELPISSHLLIAVPAIIVLAYSLIARRVVPTVNPRVLISLGIFLGFILASLLVSEYRFVSVVSALEWMTYALIMAAVIAAGGRETGPRVLLGALAVGGAIVALKGIQEYAGMRSIDPTWRIFAGWVNQNALAGALNLCFFAALGVSATGERLVKLGAGLAAALIAFALFLTQSRGGILSCGLGLGVWIVFGLVWRNAKVTFGALIPLALTGLMIAGLSATALQGKSGSALDRFTSAGTTQEQSAGYRQLLWKSAIGLAKERPAGFGINTFRFVGSKPGITPPTQLAHSTYLQLAAEISWVGLVAFGAMLAFAARELVRGAKSLPNDQNVLRASILAALASSLLHNQIDSLLYHFGIGVIFFSLIGIGLLLSADGVGPEYLPKAVRTVGCLVGCGAVVVGLGIAARGEILKAQALSEILTTPSQARTTMQTAADWSPSDGEPTYYLGTALGASDPVQRIRMLEQSATQAPTLRTLRALARAQAEAGQRTEAVGSLRRALTLDPNNLSALKQLMVLYSAMEQTETAQEIARRLVAVEEKPYLKVRAIPELVVTETAEARLFLARTSVDPADRQKLLREAVAIYAKYRDITVPRVKSLAEAGNSFGGESVAEAREKMLTAAEAANALARDYRVAGAAEDAASFERSATELSGR